MRTRQKTRVFTAPLLLTTAALALGTVAAPGAAGGAQAVRAVQAVRSAPAAAAACPTSAIKKGQTVQINFWESASKVNLTTLQTLTDAFNSSQRQVHVNLVTQNGTDDTWTKYEASLSAGGLPNVVQVADQQTEDALETGSFLPVQDCIDATHYSTADFLPRPLDYWKVNGQQLAMPFAVSVPVLYYNKKAFTRAHLNPNDPPATLPQMIKDATVLDKAGTPAALKLDSWHLETWLASANQLFVNHQNGRTGRATKAVFDTKTGRQIFTDLDNLVKKGGAATNPSTGDEELDNLIGISNGKYGMTIDTSGDLGDITALLAGGAYPNVKLGVGTFPALTANAAGGIEPGGSALYITKKGASPAQLEASWKYLEFLESPKSDATWAAGTGYVPVRKSSAASALMQRFFANSPGYKVAYDEILDGPTDAASTGSVLGPYTDVRTDVLDAESSMYTSGVSPSQALATALQNVNATISQYNQRLGS